MLAFSVSLVLSFSIIREETKENNAEVISHLAFDNVGQSIADSFIFTSITHQLKSIMTALRIFPFIGAFTAVAAVVLAIIGVSTDYWLATDLRTHSGKTIEKSCWNNSENVSLCSVIRSLAQLYPWYLHIDWRWSAISHRCCGKNLTWFLTNIDLS